MSEEKKSYYEIQVDALNSIENLKDKLEYVKKLDFNQPIEKDCDAEIIKGIKISKEGWEEIIRNPPKENNKEDLSQGDFLIAKSREIITQVSDHLLKKYIFKTIFGKKGTSLFLYEDGIFTEKGDAFIRVESEKIIGFKCSNNLIKEILGKIERQTATEREDFEKVPENLIPFQNGVYNLETKELEEYKQEYNFKSKLNGVYDKTAKCEKFMNFIEETIYPENIIDIQEEFGFCFLRRYLLKRGFIWIGGKDTGKTTLLNILTALLGEKNCCGLSLHKISQNKSFDLVPLHKKYLNGYDDLSSADISDGGGFKIATGGGLITAEYKFGDIFQFRNFAKLLFIANKIPLIKDIDDDAYFSRYIPTQFDNSVSPEEVDPELIKKLTTEQELSGILNWSLKGLNRLLKNKRFSFNKTSDEVKLIMCRSGNPLFSFVADVLEEKEGGKITKEDMHEIYRIYAKKNKLTPLSKAQLGRQLGKVANYISDKRSGGKGGRRFWENVALCVTNDTYDTLLKNIRDIKREDNLVSYINLKDASLMSQNLSKKEEFKLPEAYKGLSPEEQEKALKILKESQK